VCTCVILLLWYLDSEIVCCDYSLNSSYTFTMDELTTVSTRESISSGIVGLMKPIVEDLDERVLAVRYVYFQY
jgi:hypothetical protein